MAAEKEERRYFREDAVRRVLARVARAVACRGVREITVQATGMGLRTVVVAVRRAREVPQEPVVPGTAAKTEERGWLLLQPQELLRVAARVLPVEGMAEEVAAAISAAVVVGEEAQDLFPVILAAVREAAGDRRSFLPRVRSRIRARLQA